MDIGSKIVDHVQQQHERHVDGVNKVVEGVLGLGKDGNRIPTSQNTADANLPSFSLANERNSGGGNQRHTGGGTDHLSGNERTIAIGKASETVRALFDEIDGNNNQRLGIAVPWDKKDEMQST